jgi:glycosyltransferase involved in cell wall biosynthesis
MNPMVSVIIPCYNRADIIGAAIDSVLCQTFRDWELIIVDDGSTDNIAEVLAAYNGPRIRLVKHVVNQGEPTARNTGIEAATGRFIAFLDTDDVWLPPKLEKQVAAVLAAPDPNNVFCVTRTIIKLSRGRQIIRPLHGPTPGRSFGEFLYNDGGFAQSSSFFLAKSLAEGFRFCPHLRQMVDHLWFIAIGAAGARYLLVPEALTVWNNEDRIDRVSTGETLETWQAIYERFAEQAKKVAPPHVLIAAEARYLSQLLWTTSPIESLRLLIRARRSGALSRQQAALLLCRNMIHGNTYDTMRHWLNIAQWA